jgi:hypothetical protein
MELSSSWEAASCAATQELSYIFWNPKVHYRVHKKHPLVRILSQINPVQTIPSYPRSILILFAHLRLGLPSSKFPSGFPANILRIDIPLRHIRFTCPAYLILRDLSILIILREEYNLWRFISSTQTVLDRFCTGYKQDSALLFQNVCDILVDKLLANRPTTRPNRLTYLLFITSLTSRQPFLICTSGRI